MQRNNGKKQNNGKTNQSERVQCLALWASKSGKCLVGTATDKKGVDLGRVIGFANTNKRNEKEPDIRVHWMNEDGKAGEECVALWKKMSKGGNTYISGKTSADEYLFGFYRGDKAPANAPLISMYYQMD